MNLLKNIPDKIIEYKDKGVFYNEKTGLSESAQKAIEDFQEFLKTENQKQEDMRARALKRFAEIAEEAFVAAFFNELEIGDFDDKQESIGRLNSKNVERVSDVFEISSQLIVRNCIPRIKGRDLHKANDI